MKDELGGKLMIEFVGLRPKLYSYAGESSGKRAKGVNRSVLKKTITHEDYKVHIKVFFFQCSVLSFLYSCGSEVQKL